MRDNIQSATNFLMDATIDGSFMVRQSISGTTRVAVAPTPEPSTQGMMAMGIACAAWGTWRRVRGDVRSR